MLVTRVGTRYDVILSNISSSVELNSLAVTRAPAAAAFHTILPSAQASSMYLLGGVPKGEEHASRQGTSIPVKA